MKTNSAIYKSYPFGKNINQCANFVVAFVRRALSFLLRLTPCNPLGGDFCGSLKKAHGGRFALSSLARFFWRNPQNSRKTLPPKFSLKFWQRCLSIAFFLALTLIAFCGCAQKVAFKEVFVPQKCSVSEKVLPAKTGELLKDIDAILIYTELLEKDLKVCIGLE